MADTYGLLQIPVVAGTNPAGDPALRKVGEYIAAVLNEEIADAWAALRPRSGAEALPVRNVFTHDPEELSFNDNKLPAIFIWRGDEQDGEQMSWGEVDDRTAESNWRLMWILPPEPPIKQIARLPFFNAVAKAIDAGIELARHPAWVDADDTDVTAPSIAADVDSIRTASATDTAPVTYSGVQLNGAVGGAVMSPRRAPTITTAAVDPGLVGDPGDGGAGEEDGDGGGVYNTSDPIVWTVVDWYNQTTTRSVMLTMPFGGETITVPEDVKQVVSIAIPGQLSDLGTIELGTAAVEGRGSVLMTRASLARLEAQRWRIVPLQIDVMNADGRVERTMVYDALMMNVLVHERLVRDRAAHYDPHTSMGTNRYFKDGLLVGEQVLPDANG